LFPKPLEKLPFLTALENKKAAGLSTDGFVCVVGAAGLAIAHPGKGGDPTQPKPRPVGLAFLLPKPLEKLPFLTALENKKAAGLSTDGFVCVVGAAGFEPAAPCSQSRCANRTAPRPEYVCLRR
jgi:hypothetical protein